MGPFDYEGWGVVEEPTKPGRRKIRWNGWIKMVAGKIRIDLRDPRSGQATVRWFGLEAVASLTPRREEDIDWEAVKADTRERDVAETGEKLFDILSAVSAVSRIPIEELRGKRKTPEKLNLYRHLAFYLMREWTSASFPMIGAAVNRDHSSIIHGVQLMVERIKRGMFADEITKIRALMAEPRAVVMDGLAQEVAGA
jgi:hypothetical protein